MTTLAPAFATPVLEAQSTFRGVLDAMARPGLVVALSGAVAPPAPLSRGAAAVALTLFDQDTPIWLDAALASSDDAVYWLRFHTGAPIVAEPREAAFALVADPEQVRPFDDFSPGTQEYPDRSATLILQVESLASGRRFTLTGPGIKGSATLRANPLPSDLPERLAANRLLFPRGIDLILVTDMAIAALPRSTKLMEEA